jgi:hypothetical protein
MLILIMCNYDGDTYQLSDNLEVLKKKFDREKESKFCPNRLILAKVKQDVEFGFGSQGDFFAEEVIEEWDENDEDDLIRLERGE